jgi:hypothetical protein
VVLGAMALLEVQAFPEEELGGLYWMRWHAALDL